ncbi:MAG: hypothetical protein WCJ64_13785 [Rhodospirillaceae bacterium]
MAMQHDPRKTLLQQMADLRKTIDPKVLDRARLAQEGKEPYDREAARAAVRGFLDAKTSADGGAFKRKLLAALKQFDANPPPEPQPTRRTPRQ